MKMNPVAVALRAKGLSKLIHRSRTIIGRYGISTAKMDHALRTFSALLERYSIGATFPITAVALKRSSKVVSRYLDQNIEFAVHGYTHVDYTLLTLEEKKRHFQQAREVFQQSGISPAGFRSPYLSRDSDINAALQEHGFCYVSNQPYLWETEDLSTPTASDGEREKRIKDFYQPWLASQRASLPIMQDGLVEIPVTLPDDEILVERYNAEPRLIRETWLNILRRTYDMGELFTLQLHPERVNECSEGISAVLSAACALSPRVWFARLDQIAEWWKERSTAALTVTQTGEGEYRCTVQGPKQATVLACGVEITAPVTPWVNGMKCVHATDFVVKSLYYPGIGVSPATSKELVRFLQQQGYAVRVDQDRRKFKCYFDITNFVPNNERSVLTHVGSNHIPCVQLGHWPNGTRSALAITGDIDALTLWDYGMRVFGR